MAEIRTVFVELTEMVARIRAEFVDNVLRWSLATLDAAERRVADGALHFHDLLVPARRLVGSDAETRDRLIRRYQRLLLDELQNTEPIKIELAVRIATGAAAGSLRWRKAYVRTLVDGVLVEGYADLMFRDVGLVIVISRRPRRPVPKRSQRMERSWRCTRGPLPTRVESG
ncbi:hypothetical protein EF847_22015 [Actinobacteria bacterium YIM 96077]|uniref:UvrD-like helicase ATP-binding domain-containing protein n=1 Tax=Phytoactinopolyspora halophila TaxID=1981511 RepID=A0A329QT55_9ACTN|nr:UvrD-helicase domain-containing protein [Phytoactinopolyspora halophila]AYY14966.1 hypothetical protein EF847_22015 [Actinobacteria bacterium YIM 96077]RAW15423.1 hypothetical protein DPM12_09245 [Phytoactinopolyspora halophila]